MSDCKHNCQQWDSVGEIHPECPIHNPMSPDTNTRLRPDEPCAHAGCLSHVTHPCEGCGRIAGQYPMSPDTLERIREALSEAPGWNKAPSDDPRWSAEMELNEMASLLIAPDIARALEAGLAEKHCDDCRRLAFIAALSEDK